MGAQLPARWPDGSERLIAMPKGTTDRFEGAVAGPLQCLAWLGGWWLAERSYQIRRVALQN